MVSVRIRVGIRFQIVGLGSGCALQITAVSFGLHIAFTIRHGYPSVPRPLGFRLRIRIRIGLG